MKESREEYKAKITREITRKLDLNLEKTYSIEEINQVIEREHLRGGIVKFIPKNPFTGQEVVNALVKMDLIVTDAIHKELGIYSDLSKCDGCGQYFNATKERMFQMTKIEMSPYLCTKCRREKKSSIGLPDFNTFIPDKEKEQFIKEEEECGIDCSKYRKFIEKMSKEKQ